MKTLVLVVFLSWAASAMAQSGTKVYMCFDTAEHCAQKLGSHVVLAAGSDHSKPPVPAVASALPQESQVLLADTFRWEAPDPLAKVPKIPVMIARNEKPKQGSHWGKPVELTSDSENGKLLSQSPTTVTAQGSGTQNRNRTP
jgi:hypothetical protein